jgi:hypothetical protein
MFDLNHGLASFTVGRLTRLYVLFVVELERRRVDWPASPLTDRGSGWRSRPATQLVELDDRVDQSLGPCGVHRPHRRWAAT